jgi:hypothetical protein
MVFTMDVLLGKLGTPQTTRAALKIRKFEGGDEADLSPMAAATSASEQQVRTGATPEVYPSHLSLVAETRKHWRGEIEDHRSLLSRLVVAEGHDGAA